MVVFGYNQSTAERLVNNGRYEKVPDNLFASHKSGIVSEIIWENGGYKYPMWHERKRDNLNKSEVNGHRCIEAVTEDTAGDECGCVAGAVTVWPRCCGTALSS